MNDKSIDVTSNSVLHSSMVDILNNVTPAMIKQAEEGIIEISKDMSCVKAGKN